jgi:predicted double-glycine peptidase
MNAPKKRQIGAETKPQMTADRRRCSWDLARRLGAQVVQHANHDSNRNLRNLRHLRPFSSASIGVICGEILCLICVYAPVHASTRLLHVPFVAQSEELCGGAAVAMVMRYWGSPPVYADDFAPLVDKSAGGISVGALARAVQDRGWRALPFAGTADDVQSHLARGRPVIALLETGPGRFHYVVVVAWTEDRVVFHDPAVGAHRILDITRFERAWQVAGRSSLLVLPALTEREGVEGRAASAGESTTSLEPPSLSDSPRATAGLPRRSALDSRATAGEAFLEKRWRDAATLAELAVETDPGDLTAWQLLAASRYLDGDAGGALAAWNRRGEPRVDLARIEGLGRTRHAVVAGLLDLPPQSLLTEPDLARAARRTSDLPSAQLTRVSYSPREDGTADIDVAIVERPLVPRSRTDLAAAAVYAATAREARLRLASPSGNGELLTVAARWWSGRPRAALTLEAPRLGPWTGLWRVEGAFERQTYRAGTTLIASERHHAALTFADWRSGTARWEGRAALDRWLDRGLPRRSSDLLERAKAGHHLSLSVATERRLADDRLAVGVEGAVSPAIGEGRSFGTVRLSSRWRSSPDTFASWTAAAGISAVTADTPLDLWPGGDTGVVRSALARAHPLLHRGAINASGLHQILANATLEFQRPIVVRPFTQIGGAAFVDAAGEHIDAGAGLRVRMPGTPGLLRLDIAGGLRDGRTAFSVAWQRPW